MTDPKTGQEILGYNTYNQPIFKATGTVTAPTTGIQLPDPAPSTAEVKEPTLAGLSTSLPAVNRTDVERQVKEQFQPAKDVLESKFQSEKIQLEGQNEQEKQALGGAMGVGRRFSSSAQAFIKFIDETNTKKITTLQTQRDEALANLDFKMAELINTRIKDEREGQQKDLENTFKLIELGQKQQEAAVKQPSYISSRQNAIIDLYNKGVTDPGKVQNLLNFNKDGKQTGDITLDEITKAFDVYKPEKTEIDNVLKDIGKNAAPPDLIKQVSNARTLAEAVTLAGNYLASPTGIVGEYMFYKRDSEGRGETPVDFNTYQTIDANRKARVAAAANGGGLTSQQNTTFLRITDKFQADEIIKQSDKALTLTGLADQILANPGSATNQLASLYILVKSLDPDSAVREGELELANSTQSYLGKFQTSITRLAKGQVISSDAAAQLATATKQLAALWDKTAKNRTNRYKSQAKNSDPTVGNAFDKYLTDFEEMGNTGEAVKSFENKLTTWTAKSPANLSKYEQLVKDNPDMSEIEIAQILGIQ